MGRCLGAAVQAWTCIWVVWQESRCWSPSTGCTDLLPMENLWVQVWYSSTSVDWRYCQDCRWAWLQNRKDGLSANLFFIFWDDWWRVSWLLFSWEIYMRKLKKRTIYKGSNGQLKSAFSKVLLGL
jgi:hypothetical protein